jgi:hypothetical protein
VLAQAGAPAPPAGPRGKVTGKVTSSEQGEALGFADVRLTRPDGPPVGMLTNDAGEFTFEVPVGVYTLAVRMLSYATRVVERVEVKAGEVTRVNVVLSPEAIQQKEVVVEEKASRTTEASLLNQQRRAASMGDAVGKEQISKTADSDAGEVLTRVTGLTVVGGKYVYVRGLGERYSATSLNGVRISSPEPNKRVVPLDLFPADLLDNVVVQKTYTPDQPGDFSGGVVQVNTRDFPGMRVFTQNISTSVNTVSTFKAFRTYPGGNLDWLGFDDGVRGMPSLVLDRASSVPITRKTVTKGGFTPQELEGIGESFSNNYSQTTRDAPPSLSYSQTYGDRYRVFGRELGLLGSLSYSRALLNTDAEQAAGYEPDLTTRYRYDVERSTASTLWGLVGNASLRWSQNHTYSVRGMYDRSADDETRFFEGYLNTRGLNTRSYRQLYVERGLAGGTLAGDHRFPGLRQLGVDWKLNVSQATRNEPDRRELNYEQNPSTGAWTLVGGGTGALRSYSDMYDQEAGGELNARVPLRWVGQAESFVRGGGVVQRKERESFYRRFSFRARGAAANNFFGPDSILAPPNIGPTMMEVQEDTRNEDSYDATQKLDAGFLLADLQLPGRVRLVAGARVEHMRQEVLTRQLFTHELVARADLDNTDWLPSANLTYGFSEIGNVRLAASRTVSRPDLRELSPQVMTDYVGGYQFRGNPNLRRSSIANYDLRIEVYPGLGELLALSQFVKVIDDPIERTLIGNSSDPVIEPQNSERCRNVGAEFEARLGLARITPRLQGLAVSANLTLVHSSVTLPANTVNTVRRRPLEGQSPYAANLGLFFTTPSGANQGSLLWNTFGKRLSESGAYVLPDIYEQPRHSLDMTWASRLPGAMRLKMSAKNLLDSEIRFEQTGLVTHTYRTGRGFSVGVSYGS